MIIISAIATIYTSSRLVRCTEITGHTSYEDFATAAFKNKYATTFVSMSLLVCILGFITIYITTIKTLVPSIATAFIGNENASKLPYMLQISRSSQIFWASFYSYLILFPFGCLTELSMLKYTSTIGLLCTCMIAGVVSGQFFFNTNIVPQPPLS